MTWRRGVQGVRLWWLVCAALVVALAVAALARSTPETFPFGDVAVIEIAVGTTQRQPVMLGPYSQFGWHHPGPMMFYLLAPFYALAGSSSIGLAVGALVLNLLAIVTIGWTLVRHTGALAAGTLALVLCAYLLSGGGLATSVWNPHLIVLPLVATIVLCAAASVGDGAALVGAAILVSFVAQSSVSVVPVAAAQAAAALSLGWTVVRPTSQAEKTGRRRWLFRATLVALVLWLPPLVEQATGQPGNLSKLLDFFIAAPAVGQHWRDAIRAWGDVTTAGVRPGFELPWGQAVARHGSWATTMVAVAQVAALLPVAAWAQRRGQLVLARLCLLTALASVVACWSITRITGVVGDYQIFWMSGVGALNLALVAAAVALHATADRPRRTRRLSGVVGVLLGVTMAAAAIGGLSRARQYAVGQRDQQAPRRVVAEATVDYLRREHVVRPLFRLNATSWLQAAGVVLHAYRRHGEIAVAREWVPVFGEALAPNGAEDVALEIGGACPAGRLVVAHADGLCVYQTGR